MSTRMLIDARHSEETRVTIVKGNRVEEFDFESANRVELKGNIYLAKVTRVEPSLQAAFVDYGGNRHGFLAFSEIHPDYYQIPVEDREALLAEEAAINADEMSSNVSAEISEDDDDNGVEDKIAEIIEGEIVEDNEDDNGDVKGKVEKPVEAQTDDEEVSESIRRRRMRSLKRRYKIQEVIKRRQILLVQVVKEERGNKGAALTTYMSLPGRYCVLMPNTTHGGGISRKISNVKDRRRLKDIVSSLNVPEGMGCIIRTAGITRTKTEIKRDMEYLYKTWETIRTLTMDSVAPARIYDDGSLIKRAIRDLYDRGIDEILVEGEEGYRTAKEFMKILMPSHAKNVQQYKERIPLFQRYQVESQLDTMFNPEVVLKSGGYIVINPTEALIAIDVNSGRSTKEHNIEETALKTNLEAAAEIGRQLRLRDMAGLVVIDFIDMEERSNIRAVERKMKESLKTDRARIQVGRISSLGLLEMSRQRLHPNILEISTSPCPHCQGSGRIRSIESAALHVLRAIEEEGIRGRSSHISVQVHGEVAIYILNNKRSDLVELEGVYNFRVDVLVNNELIAPNYEIQRINAAPEDAQAASGAITTQSIAASTSEDEKSEDAKTGDKDEEEEGREGRGRGRRRRRGRRGGRDRDDRPQDNGEDKAEGGDKAEGEDKAEKTSEEGHDGATDDEENRGRRRRRRGRRGGRRRRGERPEEDGTQAEGGEATTEAPSEQPAPSSEGETDATAEEKPKRRGRGRRKAADVAPTEAKADDAGEVKADETAEEKPKRRGRPRKKPAEGAPAEKEASEAKDEKPADTAEEKPKRRGRPRKKPVEEAPAEKEAPEAKDEKAEEKPKRRGRPRKKPVEEAPAEKAAPKEAAPAPAPAPEVKAEAPKPAEEAQPDKPKKRGWWSRK